MALDRPELDVAAIIERMKEVLGKKTDTELANVLEVSNKTVSSWRNRNSMPMDVIISVSFASSVSVEYILTGIDVKISTDETMNVFDDKLMELVGEKVVKSILSEYAEGELAFMSDEDIRVKGIQLAAYISVMYAHLAKAKKMLVDEAGLSMDKFVDFERRSDEINPAAVKLRERVRER